MARGMNKVFLLGNLGLDPEPQTTRDGRPAARMRVATSRRWTDREGVRQEDTQWHTVKAYGPLAELCLRFLHRGRKILVEGRLHHYSWEDERKEKRQGTEVVARNIDFLDRKGAGETWEGADAGSGAAAPEPDRPPSRLDFQPPAS